MSWKQFGYIVKRQNCENWDLLQEQKEYRSLNEPVQLM